MGKEIVYCGDCGTSLREDDFSKGRAREIDHRPYCNDCRSAPAAADPVPHKKKPSSGSHPRVGTTRRAVAAAASSGRAPLIGGAVGLLALLAVAGALSSRPAAPPEPAESPAPPRVVAAPAPRPPALRAAPAPADAAPTPEFALAKPDASVTLERWLADVQVIRRRDPEFARTEEVRRLLRQAAGIAGPRRGEVEKILADYDLAAAAPKPAPPPPPAPPPTAPKPTTPKPPAKAPQVVSFTLINAVTDKPVPGFDPMPADAVIDMGRLGLTLIDIRANLNPKSVGCVEAVLDGSPPRLEKSWPYSCTGNQVEGEKYEGFKPGPGKHTVKFTAWSAADRKGARSPTAVCTFEVIVK